MGKLLRRLQYLLNRGQAERDLQDEMVAHREMAGDSIGVELKLREEARDAWGFTWLDHLAQDVRYGARTLRGSLGFTISSVLILTMGIGLNLALFQVMDAAILRPPPVRDPDTLSRLYRRTQTSSDSTLSYKGLRLIEPRADIFTAVLMEMGRQAGWNDNAADRVRVSFVTANWFSELGQLASRGRAFQEGMDGPAAVLSDHLWRTRLASDPDVIGKTIRINGHPVTVAGVVPPGFWGIRPTQPDLWLPIDKAADFDAGVPAGDAYARVRPGLTPAAIRARTGAILREVAGESNEFAPDQWLDAYSARDRFEPPRNASERLLAQTLVIGLGLLVLLVACANLSNLQLSRSLGRMRELNMRAALGASRSRVVRQLLTESLMLAALGTAGALMASYSSAKALAALLTLPPGLDLIPDVRTALAAVAMALFSMLAIGLAPAWKVSRVDLGALIKDGARSSGGVERAWLRQILVAVQVAGSCLLLCLSALTAESLRTILSRGPGFDYHNIAVLDAVADQSYWTAVKSAVQALPETEAAVLATSSPLGNRFVVSRYPEAAGVKVISNRVQAEYFSVLRIPLLAGRNFETGDDPKTTAILSRQLALTLFGTINAPGKRFAGWTVVGVAADADMFQLNNPVNAELYLPLVPDDYKGAQLIVRARSDGGRLIAPLLSIAKASNARVVAEARLMETDLESRLGTPRLVFNAAGGTALLTLVLACLGVFGVVAYGAASRTKEIGIRLALGATRGNVLRLLISQLTWPVGVGLILGVAGVVPIARLWPEIAPLNNFALGLAASLLSVAAITAAAVPALRAIRSAPVEALRGE